MKLKEVLERTIQFFKEKKMDHPRLEAEWLIAGGLGLDRVQLYLKYEQPLQETEIAKLREFVRRRAGGEPLAYITGKKGFYKLEFKVSPDVLIPRPETETLVEKTLDWARSHLKNKSEIHILDLGCGSGCIGLTLAHELPEARVRLVDISEKALWVAKENAKSFGVEEKCLFTLGDAEELAQEMTERFDIVVANPPYIAPNDSEVEAHVKAYEPPQALYAEEGTSLLKKWSELYCQKLNKPGLMLMEMGYTQGAEMKKYFESLEKFDGVEILKDLSGLDRFVQGSLHG